MTDVKKDILDDIKKADKFIKAQLLIKKIGELKKLAKDVLLAKEKATIVLEEIGIKEKDIKRIIDFINESDDVKLTKVDREALREDVLEDKEVQRDEIVKKIEENPNWYNNATTIAYNAAGSFNDQVSLTKCSSAGEQTMSVSL
jgi:hypothetical protein